MPNSKPCAGSRWLYTPRVIASYARAAAIPLSSGWLALASESHVITWKTASRGETRARIVRRRARARVISRNCFADDDRWTIMRKASRFLIYLSASPNVVKRFSRKRMRKYWKELITTWLNSEFSFSYKISRKRSVALFRVRPRIRFHFKVYFEFCSN